MRSTNYTLSPTRINNAKAKVKPYKLSDGGGLLIEVSASGLKTWRYLIGDHVQLRRAPPPHPNPLPRVQGRGSPCWLPCPLAGEGWGEGGALAEHGR